MPTQRNELFNSQPGFQSLPERTRDWIPQSPHATADFAEFFAKGGKVEPAQSINLPYYHATQPPKIYISAKTYADLTGPSAAQHMDTELRLFATLAHEIGHDKHNPGTEPFKGKTAQEYVRYRSELEAKTVFKAFPIFDGLQKSVPEFHAKWDAVGYGRGSGLEPTGIYSEWKAAASPTRPPFRSPWVNCISISECNGRCTGRRRFTTSRCRRRKARYSPMAAAKPARAAIPSPSCTLNRLHGHGRHFMRARTCVLVVSLLILVLTGAKPMTENQNRLAEAAALAAQFRDKRDAEPYLLERSADALSAVDLDGESKTTRAPTQRLVLHAWLQLLHQIDDAKAIGFDPTRVPPRHVSPPQEDGRVLMPGAAPEQIRDPSLRETYRQALDKHRRDQIDFNRQINLKKTDDYVTAFAEDFLRGYTQGRPEQQVKEEIGNRVSFTRTLTLLKAISSSP